MASHGEMAARLARQRGLWSLQLSRRSPPLHARSTPGHGGGSRWENRWATRAASCAASRAATAAAPRACRGCGASRTRTEEECARHSCRGTCHSRSRCGPCMQIPGPSCVRSLETTRPTQWLARGERGRDGGLGGERHGRDRVRDHVRVRDCGRGGSAAPRRHGGCAVDEAHRYQAGWWCAEVAELPL